MPTVSTLLDDLTYRLRDPQWTSAQKAQARKLLSQAQSLVNAARDRVRATATVTLEPKQTLLPLYATEPNIIRVIDVYENDRALSRSSFEQLRGADHGWHKRTAARREEWCAIGRDLIAIVPGREDASAVDIVYTAWLDELVADSQSIELPDEDVPLLLDMTEALLALRMRREGQALAAVERMSRLIEVPSG